MKYKYSIYNNIYQFDNEMYLFNSHSGAFVRINDETNDYLINISDNPNIESNEHFNYFQSKGIVVPEPLCEFGQFQIRGLCQRFDSTPEQLSFVILTTTACNYRCFYCYEEGIKPETMQQQTQQAVAEFICNRIQSTKCKSLRITWFGGEPLLNTECIQKISEVIIPYCIDKKVKYSANIITNGSMITHSTLSLLNQCKITNIQITIDGNSNTYCKYKSATPQNFEDVINAICILHNKININIRLNTDGQNYEAIKSVVEEIVNKTNNTKNIYFYLAKIENCDYFNWDDFFKLKMDFLAFLYDHKLYGSIQSCLPKSKYITCGLMQQNNAVIDTDGSLLRCEHYAGNKDEVIGSVYNGNFFSNESKFIDDPAPQKCVTCSLYPICRRGCAQKRIDNGQNINCQEYKNMIRENLRFIAKMTHQQT